MDFTQAAFLVATVFSVTALAVKLFPNLSARVGVGVHLVVGVLAAFAVAYSDWGHQQIIGGKALDNLNAISLVLIGLALGGGSTVLSHGLDAVRNIGQNQSSE